MSSRLSGLQRDVLALYRSLLRAAKAKDGVGVGTEKKLTQQLGWSFLSCSNYHIITVFSTVIKEFRIQASGMGRTDFRLIEHSIRHGYKLKKMMEMPGFRVAS